MVAILSNVGVDQAAPHVLEPLVRRPRLEDLLADGRRRRVTLLCAPPGAGKTTLLATWFAGLEPDRGRWVTVTGDDEIGPVLDAAVAAGVGVVVLDDAHHLDGRGLARVERLLTALPDGLDVILAARADPPISVSTLRLHALVREIRAADLAFTPAEAGELLGQNGVHVRPADVLRLHACTEGWAAGLRLMHCALERGALATSLAEDETAAQAAVSDYLLTEVLERETPETRQFLLRTSIADRLTPELAVLLADDPHGGARLDDLHRRGVFMVALDQGWYRYHSLFAALLRARLRVEDPILARELHRWAACWFASQELLGPAERHARIGEQWTLLGDLVRRRWRHAVIEGTLGDGSLVDPLPAAALAADPALALLSAQGGPGPVGAAVGLVDEAAIVGRLRASRDGDAADVAPHRCRDTALRPIVGVLDAELLLAAGDTGTTVPAALAVADEEVPSWVRADARTLAALAMAIDGHLDPAAKLATDVPASGSGPTPGGRLAEAASVLATALVDAQRSRPIDRTAIEALVKHPSWAIRVCARTVLACRNPETGVQGFDPVLARQPLVGRVLIALGALDVVDSTGARVAVGGEGERAVLQARRAIAAGAPHAAEVHVAEADGVFAVHPRTACEAAVIRAVAGADDGVVVALAEAAPSGIWAPFVAHGDAIGSRIDGVARRPGPQQSVAIEVLGLLRVAEPVVAVDPLTGREATVLQLLPSLMSNEEIAVAMHLSVNTVKTHLKALYRKLAVERRRDAVVRARELGLL